MLNDKKKFRRHRTALKKPPSPLSLEPGFIRFKENIYNVKMMQHRPVALSSRIVPHDRFMTVLNMNKKIILTIILSGICSIAAAEWTQLNRDGNGATYIDKEKIVAKEGIVALWSLYDAEVPSEIRPNEYSHSAKTQIEFNCQEHSARTIVMVSYEQKMGTGKVMSVKNIPPQWELINAQSWKQALFKVACPKSKS